MNRKNDEISQLATGLKETELIAWKEILRQLVKSRHGNMLLSEVNLSESPAKAVNLTELVKKLVEGKWLEWDRSSEGKFIAGIRTLGELDQELRDLGAHECDRNGTAVLLTKAYRDWYFDVTGKKFGSIDNGDECEASESQVEDVGVSRSTGAPKRRRLSQKSVSEDYE